MVRRFEKMTNRDREELLSAYLDGELDGAEQARLELQLVDDPELQSELDALRRTVEMVRDLPVQPIPRNFILPQSATARSHPTPPARQRRRWAAPLLTAATSLASLLFIIGLASELLLSGSMQMAYSVDENEKKLEAPQPVAEGVAVESEAEERITADSAASPIPGTADDSSATPLPPMAIETAPTAGEPGPPLPSPTPIGAWKEGTDSDENGTDADDQVRTQGTELPVAPAVGDAPEDAGTPTPAPPTAPTPAPMPASTPEPTAIVPSVEATSIPPAPPTPDADKRPIHSTEAGGEAPEPEEEYAISAPALARLSPRRILTIASGVAAFGLALATVLAWRARRR
jgi:hypothetical protein